MDGLASYQYVRSNPVHYLDPAGLAVSDTANGPFLPDPKQKPEGWDPSWPTGTDGRGPYVQDPKTGTKWYPHPEDKGHYPHYDDEKGNRYPVKCKKPWPGQKKAPYGDQSATNPWPQTVAPPSSDDETHTVWPWDEDFAYSPLGRFIKAMFPTNNPYSMSIPTLSASPASGKHG